MKNNFFTWHVNNLTVAEMQIKIEEHLKTSPVSRFRIQLEGGGETGLKPHFQGIIQYTVNVNPKGFLTMCPGAHISKVPKGYTQDQLWTMGHHYCSKPVIGCECKSCVKAEPCALSLGEVCKLPTPQVTSPDLSRSATIDRFLKPST